MAKPYGPRHKPFLAWSMRYMLEDLAVREVEIEDLAGLALLGLWGLVQYTTDPFDAPLVGSLVQKISAIGGAWPSAEISREIAEIARQIPEWLAHTPPSAWPDSVSA